MKKRYIKTVLKIILSAVALLLIIVAAGILYIKFSDNNEAAQQSDPLPDRSVQPEIKPPKVSPKAKESAVVQTITSPITRGSTASISVKTNPSSKCKIEVKHKDTDDKEIIYKNPALVEKKSDDYGIVNWDWLMNNAVVPGKWSVTVTCFYYKNSAVVIGDMIVK